MNAFIFCAEKLVCGYRRLLSLTYPWNTNNPNIINLYLLRGKRQKERWVYISPEIIKELKKRDWKPNNANRFTFFKFLKQIKEEMRLPTKVELAPHTLRRCFATRQAINGMPLPVLQKVLGHASLSSTSVYVRAGDLDNLVRFKPS